MQLTRGTGSPVLRAGTTGSTRRSPRDGPGPAVLCAVVGLLVCSAVGLLCVSAGTAVTRVFRRDFFMTAGQREGGELWRDFWLRDALEVALTGVRF